MKYKEISKFPSVRKDLAVIVDKDVTAEELLKGIKNGGGKILQNAKVFDVYTGKGIPEGKKSLAFSLELSDPNKTMTDEEITNVLNKISDTLNKKYKAELRS